MADDRAGRDDAGRDDAGRDDRVGRDDREGRDGGGPPPPDESAPERWNRNFAELLQEIRVAQTGVQILFAFLLTLPFSARFVEVSTVDKGAYIFTLVASATAGVFLIAPVSYHRLAFRQGRKPELVRVTSTLAQIGVMCLLLAIVGALFVVMDVVGGRAAAIAVAAAVGVLGAFLWYLLPLRNRL